MGLGARVIVIAWGDVVCVYLGRDLSVFGELVVCYFFLCFPFFDVFVLVLVRAFLCPRRCVIYYEVPGPRY